MRLVGAIACGVVALDCVDHAIDPATQHLFAEGSCWVWWIIATFWVLNAAKFLRGDI